MHATARLIDSRNPRRACGGSRLRLGTRSASALNSSIASGSFLRREMRTEVSRQVILWFGKIDRFEPRTPRTLHHLLHILCQPPVGLRGFKEPKERASLGSF